jgi:hypothetical protein
MAITGRSRTAIRTAILSAFTSRLGAIGLSVDTSAGSYHYELADRLSARLLAIAGSAEDLGEEIDLRTASQAVVERWSGLFKTSRREGVAWQGTVTVTGPVSTTTNVEGRKLIANGKTYSVANTSAAVTTNGSGVGTVSVVADEAGTAAQPETGAVLRWFSAPDGFNPTGTVASTTVDATDQESDDDFRARTIADLRARPASGSPAHIKDICEAHVEVSQAYVFPLLQPNAGAYSDSNLDKPGCWVALVAGPPQGEGTSNTRDIGADALALVNGYLDGTHDADGNVKRPRGSQLYYAGLDPADVAAERPIFSAIDVEVAITPDDGYEADWTGTMTVDGASTVGVLKVSGDHTAKNGLDVLVEVLGGARGSFVKITLPDTSTFGGGVTTWNLSEDLPDAPTGTIYPPVAHYDALRLAYFDLFDGLGPGDVPTLAEVPLTMTSITRRPRWPSTAWQGRATVAPEELIATAVQVTGTLDVSVVAPVTAPTIGTKVWPILGRLLIRPA